MNAILKELVDEASKYAYNATKDYSGDEPSWFMDYYTEKLAELIVLRCARSCVENIADPRDTIELQCAQKIKLTFGIK
jgi:hypothetical protein